MTKDDIGNKTIRLDIGKLSNLQRKLCKKYFQWERNSLVN